MLNELIIRNFALIDEIQLTFPRGLNLLTGETGAGKSIVIDALGLVLGERASGPDVIRTGADRCSVEAIFDLSDASPATHEYLRAEGLIDEGAAGDDQLIVSRELSRSGRNQCRINGRLMPVASLRQATDGLVDVHGQHEHQSLLSPDRHLDLLDSWLGDKALTLRHTVGEYYAQANSVRRSLTELRETAKERARNIDLYRFQQGEIENAGLTPGEEDDLAVERSRLMNSEKLSALADEAYASLNNSGLDSLNSALASAQKAAILDPQLEPVVAQLTEAVAAADDARRALRDYRDDVEFNPERLEEIEERLDLIRSLKRKYGETIEEIIGFGNDLSGKLSELDSSDEREAILSRDLEAVSKKLAEMSQQLSKVRRDGSQQFSQSIVRELRDLGMSQTRFDVQVGEQPQMATGADKVEFLLSPNPGEPLKALAKIASGGELSRIMLALKTVLSRAAYVPTLIFDEIDIGVGGRTALTIAQKLADLATTAQVFCITHLPQIASQPAAAHYFIEKVVDHGRTTIRISELDAGGRVDEIARMLGGNNQSPIVVEHARAMLGGAVASK